MNVVANAFTGKTHGILANLVLEDWKGTITIKNYKLCFIKDDNVDCVYNIITTLSLL